MEDDERERTLWCGNLHESVTEEMLYELFLQAGPLESVIIPKDKEGKTRNYSFIRFKDPVSVVYTIDLMNGIRLFERPLRLQSRSGGASSTPGQNQPGKSPMGNEQGAPFRSPHGGNNGIPYGSPKSAERGQPYRSPHSSDAREPPYVSPQNPDRGQPFRSPQSADLRDPPQFSRSFSSPQLAPIENNPFDKLFNSNSRSGSNTPEPRFAESPDNMRGNEQFRSFPPGLVPMNMGLLGPVPGMPNMDMNFRMGGIGFHRHADSDPSSLETKRQRILQQQEEMMSRSSRHHHHQPYKHHGSSRSSDNRTHHGYRKKYN